MQKIVLASNNLGKIREIQQLLANIRNIEILPQSLFNVPPVAETGLTFVENAILKARHAAKHSGLPAIADDSGIQVQALQGAPGIYSARYAGENATDHENVEKLLDELKNEPMPARDAVFICVIAFLKNENDATPLIFQGTWRGKILFSPQGTQGFGYDPIFYVPTHDCSAAQLPPEIKNQISHRGQASRKLIEYLVTHFI